MAVNGITTTAWFPADCRVKMQRRDTGSITTFTTLVTSWDDGGGARNIESIPHFGDAFLLISKPQEDYEVSFDVDVTDTTWAEVMTPNVTVVAGSARMVKSDGSQKSYKIKLEWLATDTSEAFKILYYNAKGVDFTQTQAADDRLTGTIKFQLSPKDGNGSGQKYYIETVNRSNAGVGSSLTGSYGAWEAAADTLFGYGTGSML